MLSNNKKELIDLYPHYQEKIEKIMASNYDDDIKNKMIFNLKKEREMITIQNKLKSNILSECEKLEKGTIDFENFLQNIKKLLKQLNKCDVLELIENKTNEEIIIILNNEFDILY